jgi:hypothetical protein|tara:strand:- start:170 stop:451 length:282 start_codon:yes stop_codon:yes gene_type:complete
MTHLVYNLSMTNNDTNNKGNKDMINATHNVRVIKHIDGNYDTYANFTTVQNALHHMRRMDFANDCWYIIDANDNRLKMNNQGELVVFNSLIGR